jgi:hypothetical protein
MEGKSNVINFNLQGTHKYSLARTNIQNYPNTFLAKLIQNQNSDFIFISQDGELFRWICMFYNLGIMVDHTETSVSERVWEAYLDFFGLLDAHPNVYKRSRLDVKNEIDIIDSYKRKLHAQTRGNILEACKILAWMVENNMESISIVELSKQPPVGVLEMYPFDYKNAYKLDGPTFGEACKTIGLTKIRYSNNESGYPKWNYEPAVGLKEYQNHNARGYDLTVVSY